jgi:hypothetical protein
MFPFQALSQGTFTPSDHAHVGRTPAAQPDSPDDGAPVSSTLGLMTMPRNLFVLFSFVVSLLLISSLLADDNLPAKDRLKSCDPHIALAAAKEILGDPKTLKEPLEMLSPAFILFQNGEKDEAVFWFYAAQLRVRYQLAFEKGNRGQLLSIMLMTIGPPINNYAFQDVRKLDRIIDRVLEWDKITPNPFRETLINSSALMRSKQ